MEIEIINAKPEQAKEIQEVFYRTWLDTYPNEEAGITVEDIEDKFKDRDSEERLEKRRRDLTGEKKNVKFLVALDGSRIIGLSRASKNEKENRLTAIYVLPEYQGKGIGTRLWNETKNFFNPSKDIFVGVATYNQKAIHFYSKLGFVDTGRRYTEERHRMKSGAIISEVDMRFRNPN